MEVDVWVAFQPAIVLGFVCVEVVEDNVNLADGDADSAPSLRDPLRR